MSEPTIKESNTNKIQEEETGKSLGRRIKTERIKRDMSQRQLSELTGINHVTLSRIEKGETTPGFKQLQDIVDAFNIEKKGSLDPNLKENDIDRELRGMIEEHGIQGIFFRKGMQIEDLTVQEKKNIKDSIKSLIDQLSEKEKSKTENDP